MAINFSISYTFTSGTTISSSQVNTNFSDEANVWIGLEAKTKTFSNLVVDTLIKSTGTIEAAAGAVGAPSYTFTADTDTGLYNSASNTMKATCGNANVLTLAATGVAVLGTTTNDSAATGYVGEYVESVIGTTNFPSTGTFGNATSISLTPGDWDVCINSIFIRNGATVTGVEVGISTTTADASMAVAARTDYGAVTSNTSPLVVPPIRFSLSATTTVYWVYEAAFSVATPQTAGKISARRVR